jgi:hypothetical protein
MILLSTAASPLPFMQQLELSLLTMPKGAEDKERETRMVALLQEEEQI